MCRLLPLAALTIFVAAGNTTLAQYSRGADGPLLIPHEYSLSYGGNGRYHEGRGHDHGGYYDGRGDGRSGYGEYPGPVAYDPSRMRQVANWYRELLGREMTRAEEIKMRGHTLEQHRGAMTDILARILGSAEFYNRVGGRFDRWVDAVENYTSRDISRREEADWSESHRHAPGREAQALVRTDFVRHLYEEHPREPVVVPDRGYRGRPVVSQPELPWYADHVGHDHGGHRHTGHRHTAGYGPVAQPSGDPAIIADWYRTYFGREIAPHELQKWLSDRQKGMPLDEIYASVLAAPEWYVRTGGSPTRWIAATLDALGQGASRDGVGYWYDRYQRHNGDRFKVAKEMVRSAGGLVHDRRRDRHDDDD